MQQASPRSVSAHARQHTMAETQDSAEHLQPVQKAVQDDAQEPVFFPVGGHWRLSCFQIA